MTAPSSRVYRESPLTYMGVRTLLQHFGWFAGPANIHLLLASLSGMAQPVVDPCPLEDREPCFAVTRIAPWGSDLRADIIFAAQHRGAGRGTLRAWCDRHFCFYDSGGPFCGCPYHNSPSIWVLSPSSSTGVRGGKNFPRARSPPLSHAVCR